MCNAEDGKQSRVEFIRSIHERKAGRYSDTSNESKPVIPKVDDLPPSGSSSCSSSYDYNSSRAFTCLTNHEVKYIVLTAFRTFESGVHALNL